MSEAGGRCSEESLSALLDNELEWTERRALALHVAGCMSCARTLGQLFAARACVAVPAQLNSILPRHFWRGVRSRLNEVDSLARATDAAGRRRPVVSPRLIVAAAALLVVAVAARPYLMGRQEVPTRLTRLHLAASLGPHDPGLQQAIGFRPSDAWEPVSRSVININGVWALQTIYMVGGLAVSVFRLPAGTLNTERLAQVRVGEQNLYLAAMESSTMVAKPTAAGWDVVVSRSRPEHTMSLCLSCPREEMLPQSGAPRFESAY